MHKGLGRFFLDKSVCEDKNFENRIEVPPSALRELLHNKADLNKGKITLRASSEMNSSSSAVKRTLSNSLMIPDTFSGEEIRYRRSRAITLIKISFSYKHSTIVLL